MSTITLTPVTNTTTSPLYPTRTYQDLLKSCCWTAGIEPDDLQDPLAFRDWININLREIWEYYPWPKFMRVEETTAGNIDNFSEHDLFGIFKYDPRDKRYPQPYTWTHDAEGINIIQDLASTATIYVQYRDLFYPYMGTEYSTTTTYTSYILEPSTGMAYETDTGDYYRSLANSNLDNALTNTSFWERRGIPSHFYEYVRLMVSAELLDAMGQGEKSASKRAQAAQKRDLEIEKWERQKNLQQRPQVKVRSGG